MVGRTIGRYRVTAKLGEGGMGSVWAAEDPVLARTVALKFLPAAVAADAEARARFLREARAASRLRHPGIATVHDAGEADGQVYLALEHVDGETVSDRVARGPLPLRDAVRIAREAASALEHAHAQGVLHRDVTGRNVMVDRDGHARVVDFGLALPEGETRLTRTGTTFGTAAYLAPEVIAGKPADRRSDVYGLGVVLYEMATGRLPFTGDRAERVLYAAAHEPPAPPGQIRAAIPRALERTIVRALAKDPAARFQTAAELEVALRDAATGTRRRAGWVAAGVALALLVFIALWQEWVPLPGGGPRYSSVAVLPLANLSDDPAESYYLSDSIGDLLTSRLTQLEGLRVIPWVTSLRYQGSEASHKELAAELGVDALLTGQFREVGGRLQGSLSLVDGRSGEQVWTERFEEPVRQGFLDVVRKLAVDAGTRVRGRLDRAERDGLGRPLAASFEAFDLYLQGSDLLHLSEDPRTYRAALRLFERAIDLDPGLAEAYVGAGTVHKERYYRGWGGMEDLDRAEERFRTALEIDPGLVRARGGLVRVHWERGEAEPCLQQGQAVAGRPEDVDALLVRVEAYCFCGLPERALPLTEEILRLDPRNAGARFFQVVASAWTRQHEETLRAGRAFLDEVGEDSEVYLWMVSAHISLGENDEARALLDHALEIDPESERVALTGGAFLSLLGEDDEAQRWLTLARAQYEENVREHPDNPRTRADFAALLFAMGDREGFMREAERALQDSIASGFVSGGIGDYYLDAGDLDHGLALLRKSLEQGWIPARTAWEIFHPKAILEDSRYEEFWEEVRRAASRLHARY